MYIHSLFPMIPRLDRMLLLDINMLTFTVGCDAEMDNPAQDQDKAKPSCSFKVTSQQLAHLDILRGHWD